MEQNASWKAYTSLASQEIPRILWDPKLSSPLSQRIISRLEALYSAEKHADLLQ